MGIQSAAYTVNAKDIGEMPMGLISFHVVCRSMFGEALEPAGQEATVEGRNE